MKFRKFFILLTFCFMLKVGVVYADDICLHVYEDLNSNLVYIVSDYDYFCGNNSQKMNCYRSSSIYGGADYQLSKNNISGASKVNKVDCKISGELFDFDNNCYKVTNVSTGSSFYSRDENEIRNNGIYKLSPVSTSKCSTNSKSSSGFVNYDKDEVVSCGKGLLTDIPRLVPKVVHIIYLVIEIAVPILLIIFGSIDFVKAIVAQKEDEIKKGQQTFIKRLIAGVLVFFVFAIVKLIISFAGDDNKSQLLDCASCFINNDSSCVGG